MKRYGHLFEEIVSLENLRLADQKARKGKKKQKGVILHDLNSESNLFKLHTQLINGNFSTSKYSTFSVFEPKERLVYCLPYYPDRIVHHAIMNVIEPILIRTMTRDTYSCIKGRGVMGAFRNLKVALKDIPGTKYCLKLDIKKFYPSIDHDILKQLLRRKFKDAKLLQLLDEIIDSADGVPIGNYLSQFFANFYLCYFDHWIKEQLKVKYYFRYADDMVILSDSKKDLHHIRFQITQYMQENLKLHIKQNYQVFPVASRGIDFLGYRFFHSHILLRKSIKQNFARAVKKGSPKTSLAAYNGWACHADCKNLIKTLTDEKV